LLLEATLSALPDDVALVLSVVGVLAHLALPFGSAVVVVFLDHGDEDAEFLEFPDPLPKGAPCTADGSTLIHHDHVERAWGPAGVFHESVEVVTLVCLQRTGDTFVFVGADVLPALLGYVPGRLLPGVGDAIPLDLLLS